VKAYPNTEIVEVHRFGTFAERLDGTMKNLMRAINRARNEGKLAIYAEESTSETTSGGAFPSQIVDRRSLELCREGGYPFREPIVVSPSGAPASTLVSEDCLALSSSSGTSGNLSLDMSKCFDLCSPVIEARVIAFDAEGNAGYSDPQYFELRDSEKLSAELIDPFGRPAVLRFKEGFSGELNASMIEVVDKGFGYAADTLQIQILSASGQNGSLSASLDENGSISGEVTVLNAGSGYGYGDVLLCSAPVQYQVGQPLTLRARVNDPLNELGRVAFYANGVELTQPHTVLGNVHLLTFTPDSEDLSFLSVRALYGDGRDDPPTVSKSSSCGCSASYLEDCHMGGQSCWGWRRSWEQQHCHPTDYLCPPWFWGQTQYWAWPPPWQSMPTIPGALALQSTLKSLELTFTIYPRDENPKYTQ
jgi:hypothetical protein